jgi:hypothetical protein
MMVWKALADSRSVGEMKLPSKTQILRAQHFYTGAHFSASDFLAAFPPLPKIKLIFPLHYPAPQSIFIIFIDIVPPLCSAISAF